MPIQTLFMWLVNMLMLQHWVVIAYRYLISQIQNNPSAVATVATTGTDPSGVYIQGKYAYVTERAGNLLEVFDISNPSAPNSVGSETVTIAFSVYVQGRYAYVTSFSGNSLQIVDISDPTNPSTVGSGVSTNSSPSSVKVQGRYAYVVNAGTGSLQVIDVYNPSSASVVGTVKCSPCR